MNTEELRNYVKSLPEEISTKFVKKEFNNRKTVVEQDLVEFFSVPRTVGELREYIKTFTNEATIVVKEHLEYDYDEHESVYLEAKITDDRYETDEELTERILKKVERLKKASLNNGVKP